jgi:hypothetical protein
LLFLRLNHISLGDSVELRELIKEDEAKAREEDGTMEGQS